LFGQVGMGPSPVTLSGSKPSFHAPLPVGLDWESTFTPF